MIFIKQNRSWSKPDNIPGLIARKKVDWSIFIYGSHIPLDFHEDFEEANQGLHIEIGENKVVELIIDNNIYRANLININRKAVDSDTLQIRYDNNNELKDFLKDKFKVSYEYLKNKRDNEETNSHRQYNVPEEIAEYIEFYKTGEPFKYRLRLITAKSDVISESRHPEFVFDDRGSENINVKDVLEYISQYIASKGFSYPEGLIENFYLSLKTKPFVLLAGISGTGKTKLVKLFAEAIRCNYKLISVRPDWSDSSDLLGYKNIQGKFIPGPIIDYIKAANEDPENIYFVCLDEMNLARVEYYFSDFLSIMETRQKVGQKIKTEKLLSERYFEKDEDKVYANLIIPDNLYLIGTVNMDETTHPFSKKVLDRANTIEFTKIYLTNYRLNNAFGTDENIGDIKVNNDFLRAEYINLNDCNQEDEELIAAVINKLEEINNILEECNLQVGYRIRDEICFYMIYNQREDLLDKKIAFDFQLIQKILPRIQGSSDSIKKVLIKLFQVSTGRDLSSEEGEIGDKAIDYVVGNNGLKYPQSAHKIAYMIKRFEEDGFTAYWL